jgi:hypothetical protein
MTVTQQELAGVIARLAVNYGRTFDDDDALLALVSDWEAQLGEFELRDVELAREGLMGDPAVRWFPTVADMRRRTQLARMDRRRESGEGGGCAACVGSGGSIGWQHTGTDEAGREYVRSCPRGCRPPLPSALARRVERTPQEALPLEDQRAKFQAALAGARAALTRPLPAAPMRFTPPPPDPDDPYAEEF